MARAKKTSTKQSNSKKAQDRLNEADLAVASGGAQGSSLKIPNPIKGIQNAVGLRQPSNGVPKVKPTGQYGVGNGEVLPIWEQRNTTEPGRSNAPRR